MLQQKNPKRKMEANSVSNQDMQQKPAASQQHFTPNHPSKPIPQNPTEHEALEPAGQLERRG